jgi:hypothetical protein
LFIFQSNEVLQNKDNQQNTCNSLALVIPNATISSINRNVKNDEIEVR